MGATLRKLRHRLSPGPPLNYEDIMFIMSQSLIITSHSGLIYYNITERQKYYTLDRNEVEKALMKPDFENIISKNPSLAVFPAIGNFRSSFWSGTRRRTCYIFIDNRRLLWIADPSNRTIVVPRYSYQIDQVSSI